MSVLTANELKARFSTLDRPSQKDYTDLIDSLIVLAGNFSATPGAPFFYSDATLTGSIYVATYVPSVVTYVDGGLLIFKADVENPSGGTSFDGQGGSGAAVILKEDGLPLQAGDIQAGQIVEVRYRLSDNTWQMILPTSRPGHKTGDIITSAAPIASDANRLLCDGTSYLRTDYPDLFASIGTIYGSIDGTHFNVPDYRGRFPLGTAVGYTLPSTTPVPLGGTGGGETISVDVSLPAHTHFVAGDTTSIDDLVTAGTSVVLHGTNTSLPGNGYDLMGDATTPTLGLTSSAGAGVGGSTDYSVMPPWIGAYYYILT